MIIPLGIWYLTRQIYLEYTIPKGINIIHTGIEMTQNDLTTLKVTKESAEEIKRLFPELRNDAYRVAALLRFARGAEIVSIDELPRPDDQAQRVPVVTVRER
jgi:hypothetical protein